MNNPQTVSGLLRPETTGDASFLADLFRLNARRLYGAAASAFEPIIDLQHEAQTRAYASAYPDARREVILLDGRPAGRLITAWDGMDVHVVDIAILPDDQRRGLARKALSALLREAAAAGRPVTAQVMVSNAASLALFGSLGFHWTHEAGAAQAFGRRAP